MGRVITKSLGLIAYISCRMDDDMAASKPRRLKYFCYMPMAFAFCVLFSRGQDDLSCTQSLSSLEQKSR